MKPYVIGNENSILGFSLVGVDGRVVSTAGELNEALETVLQDQSIGLVMITSGVADLLRERVDELKINSLTPLVVEVPGQEAERAYPSLAEFVQKAVGISLRSQE